MQLRRVTTPTGPSVAIWHAERWVPLRAALAAYATQGRSRPAIVADGVDNVVACLRGAAARSPAGSPTATYCAPETATT